MKLIAFAGRAGSGKNTAARGLSAHYETSELAMADPLYDALGALIGLSPFDDNDLRTLCEDRDFKRAAHKALGGLSPREALQQLGDWVRSSLGQDFLLRRAEERLAILEDFQFQVDLAVVTDVRTEREAAWVREQGGLLGRDNAIGARCDRHVAPAPVLDAVQGVRKDDYKRVRESTFGK